MGIPVLTFFGNKTKEELEKELAKVEAEMDKLAHDKAKIKKALEAYDSSAKG